KTGEVFENVKLPAVRKSKAGSGVAFDSRHAGQLRHVGATGAKCSAQFLLEHLLGVVAAEKEIAIDAPEVAVDSFTPRDCLDSVDRRAMTLDDFPGTFQPVDVLEHVDAIVHRVREMRGGPSALSATDRAIVEHDDALAVARQLVRRRQPSDARPDDADVG